jgi:GAF domain-containing protein
MPNDVRELYEAGREHELTAAADFATLARELQSQESERGTLQAVCELAKELLNADHAAFTALKYGRFRTVASTSEVPRAVDEIQYDLDEGPCVYAIEEQTTFRSHDLGVDPRWPRFGPQAVERTGIRSMLSHRIFVEGDTMGALNLYAIRPAAFGEDQQTMGVVFATHAALAMQAVRAQDRARHLAVALESNRRIGTAIGVLMVRHQWREKEAFDAMRKYSQDHNIRLADVAERVVLTGALGG